MIANEQDLDKINHNIDEKLDRTEIDALRDYMEKQLKKLKKLAVNFIIYNLNLYVL